MQKFIKIFHSVQEIEPFSLDKASTNDKIKCHFANHWARSFQHQIVCKILSKYSKRFKGSGSLFSEFEPRQNLDQSQMSFDYPMGYIMSISMCMQNFITLFHSIQRDRAIFTFSEFGARQSLADEKCHFAIILAISC